jgi:hypothetical protein
MQFCRILPAVLCAGFLLFGSPLSTHAQVFHNTVNERFNTISDGPQSAVIVNAPASGGDAALLRAQTKMLLGRWQSQIAGVRRGSTPTRSTSIGSLSQKSTVTPVSTVLMTRKNGRMVMPPVNTSITRQAGANTLTFKFVGFNGATVQNNNNATISVEAYLRGFVDAVYPRIVSVYGAPAVSGEVEIRAMGFFDAFQMTDRERLAFGAYDASNNRILLPLYENIDDNAHALLLNMIHAFHGPKVFQYDAWEQGFARAAASVIARDPAINFLDPTANSVLSYLRYYDLMNHPALGNSTFFPAAQRDIEIQGQLTYGKMHHIRLGMSGAAWLKVFIENPTFFRDFNALYYAQDAPTNPALAGNIPALKQIAQGLLPNGVEGKVWQDWYKEQYILDTSIIAGEKLYPILFPTDPEATADRKQSALVILQHFRTEANGDEKLLGGRAYGTYFNSKNDRIGLGTQSEQQELFDGEAFFTILNFPAEGFDDGRVTADYTVGSQTARTYFPSGISGDTQIIMLGPARTTGELRIVQEAVRPLPRTLTGSKNFTENTNAAMGFNLRTDFVELSKTTIEIRDTGGQVLQSVKRNTGDGRAYIVLRGENGGTLTTVSRAFASQTKPYLVSFPVQPLSGDLTEALGLPATDFFFSEWDPLGQFYTNFDGTTPAVGRISLGRGYWLKVSPEDNAAEKVVRVTGYPPSTDTSVVVSAPFGWNLIGYPHGQLLNLSNIQVRFLEGDIYSWDDAVAANLVAPRPFGFNGQAYIETEQLDGRNWQGYWLRVYAPSGVTLLLPRPEDATRSVSPTRATSTNATRPTWAVNFVARQNNQQAVATATIGVAPNATRGRDNRWDIESPPDITPQVALAFALPSGEKATSSMGGRLIRDFRDASATQNGTWEMRLATPNGGPVALNWDGLNSLPRQTKLTLTDIATGRKTPLASRSGITLTLGANEVRRLQITAEPTRRAPLALAQFSATPTRGIGSRSVLQLSYAMTTDAQVNLQVTTLSGRNVKNLQGGRATGGTTQRLTWDGRDNNGNILPTGPYQIVLTGTDADGQSIEARRPVLLIK